MKVLYLGSDPSYFSKEGKEICHCPLIKIVPRCLSSFTEIRSAFDDIQEYTHILFTSKNAVNIFFALLEELKIEPSFLETKELIAVGRVTADTLQKKGQARIKIAKQETQEGVIEIIRPLYLDDAYFFLPRSSLSRPLLAQFLIERGIRHQICEIYDTVFEAPPLLPDLKSFDEIIFTSPSTVNAFFKLFAKIPLGKRLGVLGPITEQALMTHLTQQYEVFYV